MGKKKSCQNVRIPRPLNAVERGLYGWVEETIFTQHSILEDSLPELRRHMSLTENAAAKGDFVLEAAGLSDHLRFQASEGDPHFLCVYQELFTRLGVRLPFTDFQKEVMTRSRVAVSQLHLNGWGLLRTFEWRLWLISFRARQGCKLFGIFEKSIQEFKWHYFKVLPAPGRHAFWLDDGGRPFPWVYWNYGVKDFVVHELDPLEMAVFDFLVSLPAAPAKSSTNPTTPSVQVPPPPPANSRAKKSSSKWERPEVVSVEGEEGAKEDPDADLKQKRCRKEKGKEEDLVDRVLSDDAAWEHAVNPLDLAFSEEISLSEGLGRWINLIFHAEASTGDAAGPAAWGVVAPPMSASLKAKTKAGEELLSVKDQLSVLKVERDSALEYLPLKEKADSLAQQLSQKEVEHRSAIERVAQLDEDIKVLKAQLEFAQLAVSKDQKRAECAESNAKTLAASLKTAHAELAMVRDEANYWCTEWKSLGTEAKEMCQETLEIVLDQVSHLYPGVDFSAITLKTRWDSKGRRIHIPEELLGDDIEVVETLAGEDVGQQQPEQGGVAGVSGECPT
ncbi:hypothetical protein PIB30_000499 [Stylosanthes scabra]|uniref:Uncharacterized protein n=1 Tax=Stylosanthes scabra TaxID=79078 RepID=A0ABU6W0F6_9FABA|nr:hypothetical protein [Stylosanthes scabra]